MCNCNHDGDSNIDYTVNEGRRRFLLDSLAAGGLAATLGLPGVLNTAMARTDDVVRIGYLPITDATPLLVAHNRGYFEDEGLEVADPELIRGWSPLVEGFTRGRYNLVHLLKPIPVWMRYNNNFPVKIMAWAHTNGSAVLMSQASGAREFSDLGGTQIAVPFWYSVHNVLLQMALRQAGLEPVIQDQSAELAPHQVNLAIMPPADMPPALAAGRIDGFTVAEPFNAAGEVLANGSLLRFTGDIWKNHPCCVLCMHEQQVEANPERTQKILNALVRAELYAQQNKAETAEMLSRDGAGYLPMPANVVRRAMTHYDTDYYAEPHAIRNADWGNGRIDFSPYPFPSATRELVRAMNKTLVGGDKTFLEALDPDHVASDLVDDRFVRRALETYPDAHPLDLSGDNPWEREEEISV